MSFGRQRILKSFIPHRLTNIDSLAIIHLDDFLVEPHNIDLMSDGIRSFIMLSTNKSAEHFETTQRDVPRSEFSHGVTFQ